MSAFVLTVALSFTVVLIVTMILILGIVSKIAVAAISLVTVVSIVAIVLILGIVSGFVAAAISLVIFGCMVMDVQAITGRRGASGLACGAGRWARLRGGCGNLGNPL